jgi:hypothetical protein
VAVVEINLAVIKNKMNFYDRKEKNNRFLNC